MAVLFGMYWIFLRKETYYQFNRIYLLGTVLFACMLPLGNFSLFESSSESSVLNVISSMGEAVRIPEVTIAEGSTSGFSLSNNWQDLVIVIYLLGTSMLLARIILGILRINGLKRIGRRIDHDGYSVVYIKQQFAPFSFFRTIFINEALMDDSETNNIILAIFWFNPFMWFLKRALRNTHEYLADNGVITTGTSLTNYQSLLLKQIHGLVALVVTNNFNSMIKNRIKMMCKSKSSVIAKFKPLLIVPALLCLTLIFAFTDSKNEFDIENLTAEQPDTLKAESDTIPPDEEIFFIVEDMPSFQGQGQEGFREWISENLVYPENAKSKGINGRVYIQFIVDTEGLVTDVKVVRSVHPDLDAEAKRVVESSPTWIPGKQREKNVAVVFTFPIIFDLE